MSQPVQKCFWPMGPIRDGTPAACPKKPAWNTGFGFTNASAVTAYVHEATSAIWLKDALDLAFRHLKFVEMFVYYDLSVGTGNMAQQKGNFGLIGTYGDTLTPAWYRLLKNAG